MGPLNLLEAIEFNEAAYNSVLLHASKSMRVVLFALKAGQKVGGHAVEPEVLMQVVKGRGIFTVGKARHRVQQGSLVVCKSNEEHGMEAVKDMVVLAVIAREF